MNVLSHALEDLRPAVGAHREELLADGVPEVLAPRHLVPEVAHLWRSRRWVWGWVTLVLEDAHLLMSVCVGVCGWMGVFVSVCVRRKEGRKGGVDVGCDYRHV